LALISFDSGKERIMFIGALLNKEEKYGHCPYSVGALMLARNCWVCFNKQNRKE
jgi:hypothetical protein